MTVDYDVRGHQAALAQTLALLKESDVSVEEFKQALRVLDMLRVCARAARPQPEQIGTKPPYNVLLLKQEIWARSIEETFRLAYDVAAEVLAS